MFVVTVPLVKMFELNWNKLHFLFSSAFFRFTLTTRRLHLHRNESLQMRLKVLIYNDSSKAAIKSLCIFMSIWLDNCKYRACVCEEFENQYKIKVLTASRRLRSCSIRRASARLSVADIDAIGDWLLLCGDAFISSPRPLTWSKWLFLEKGRK